MAEPDINKRARRNRGQIEFSIVVFVVCLLGGIGFIVAAALDVEMMPAVGGAVAVIGGLLAAIGVFNPNFVPGLTYRAGRGEEKTAVQTHNRLTRTVLGVSGVLLIVIGLAIVGASVIIP